jgi:hypothetical protein
LSFAGTHQRNEAGDLTVIDEQCRREQPLRFFIGIEYAAHQILDQTDQLQALADIRVQSRQICIELNGALLDRRQPVIGYPAAAQFAQKRQQFAGFTGESRKHMLAFLLRGDGGQG